MKPSAVRRSSLLLALALAAALLSSCGQSNEPTTSAVPPAEIETALTGNTIIGEWLGERYRQYFDADGTTIYLPIESGRTSSGRWRINATSGMYESRWSDTTGWEPYAVTRTDDTWFWSNDRNESGAFRIVPGNQLESGG